MTDITTYPMIDDFDTTLAQAWDGATGTVYLNEAVGITLPANTTTYIVVNPGKSIMQVAEINAVNNTLKTVTVSNITVDKGAGVAYTQQTHPVGSVVRISTNYAFWKDIVDSVNSKVDSNSADIEMGKFADATARDAYFTSPVNGNSAYLTSEGKWTDYVGGSWVDRDQGTVTANASETVAGKVEIATQAEFDAGTATGGTGAILVSTTDQIRKQINTATAKTTPVNADSIAIADSAASGVIKKTTLTQLKAASDMQATTTTSGFVEMATDAEALAGTDESKYINPKQLLASKTYNQTITKVNASINNGGTANTTSINLSSKGGFITAYGFVTNTSGSSRNMYSRLQISDNGSSWSTLTDLLNVTVSGTSAQPDYIRSFSFIVSKGKYIRGEVYGSGTNSGAYIEISYQELT